MPTADGTLLCLFSNDKCIIIDDFKPALKGIYRITDIWPQLLKYGMGDNLDAAYFCPEHTQVAFFKGDQCAVYNYNSKAWIQGKISQYYQAPASTGNKYYSNLTAASTGVNDVNYAFYSGTNFITGLISGQDPFTAPVKMTQTDPEGNLNDFNLAPGQELVASALVAELTAYGSQGDGKLERCLFIYDQSDGRYKFTFDEEGVSGFTPVPGMMPLTELWPQYSDSVYPIQAATRVDPSILAHAQPLSSPVPNTNPLCDELGNIMKSVCSLTLLMHKAIDACYPPSQWPTQPYPDGCSSAGSKHHRCGCQGQPTGTPTQTPTGQSGGPTTHP